MKVSLSWLQDWLDSPLSSPEEVAQILTMAGLEVDEQIDLPVNFQHVQVGEVLETAPHPDADKLKVCTVSVGKEESLTIVCGAKNVAAGQKVPVAMVGALLPNDIKIKKAKLRGVTSQGMICAASELGLPDTSPGIMILDSSAPVGEAFEKILGLPDTVLDLAITPNRGDCFSLRGVARELAAFTNKQWQMPSLPAPIVSVEHIQDVSIEHDACSSYASCMLSGVDLTHDTPQWLKNRLTNACFGLTNLVVDVINYVMLETGQPMHGFDFDKLSGPIRVCCSSNESFEALNDTTCTLDDKTMIIRDEKGVLAIAGVIGGLDSAISSETTQVLLESARFTPQSVRSASKRHQYHTESSHRFERGVDPAMQIDAIKRVVSIIQQVDSSVQASEVSVVGQNEVQIAEPILLKLSEITRVLGIALDIQTAQQYLAQLDFNVSLVDEKSMKVTPPPHRFDVFQPIDLIEELARMVGYDAMPMHALSSGNNAGIPLGERERAATYLQSQGFNEAICLNMLSEAYLNEFVNQDDPLVALENPLNANMTHMRHSLIPGLLQSLAYNVARQQSRVRLFEVGDCFIKKSENIEQITRIAGVATGGQYPLQWGGKGEDVDFFDIKQYVMHLLSPYFSHEEIICKPLTLSYCHQKRSCALEIADKIVGHVATLHPKLQKKYDLPRQVVFFEIELFNNNQIKRSEYLEVSKYPSVARDLALILSDEIAMADVVASLKQLNLELLHSYDLFDIYKGDGVEEGCKSLALRLTLQHPERTLLESEINAVIDQILEQLKQKHNVRLR